VRLDEQACVTPRGDRVAGIAREHGEAEQDVAVARVIRTRGVERADCVGDATLRVERHREPDACLPQSWREMQRRLILRRCRVELATLRVERR